MEENLNIEYHRVRLILKSLNSSVKIKDAAAKCGISQRTLFNNMIIYSIVKKNKTWITECPKYKNVLQKL